MGAQQLRCDQHGVADAERDAMRFRTEYHSDDNAAIQTCKYIDGSLGIMVIGADGTPLIQATTCLAQWGHKPADGNCFIKDHCENAGVLKALQNAGVVGPVERVVPVGLDVAYEVKFMEVTW